MADSLYGGSGRGTVLGLTPARRVASKADRNNNGFHKFLSIGHNAHLLLSNSFRSLAILTQWLCNILRRLYANPGFCQKSPTYHIGEFFKPTDLYLTEYAVRTTNRSSCCVFNFASVLVDFSGKLYRYGTRSLRSATIIFSTSAISVTITTSMATVKVKA